ncbi:hypothetical protein [Fodinibius salsisoli]|uniref:Uncharacterized protein n=1 Tax=Fodinibius salsisoli TaxID=2820877 RepID=A0ABT3PK12_9BACT|nr:hypothetical protein [Fodinibius salsisoli]MCW9706262.1 hypothetical protein [Fodinibius salsisoli]
MNTLVLDISDVLHQVANAEDQCIDRLKGSLEKRNGIKQVRLDTEEPGPELCIYFDEDIISASQIKHIATQTAGKLDDTFGHLWIKMRAVRDRNHRQAVTTLLNNFKGVMNVFVIPTGWIFLEFNKYITQEATLIELIDQMDFVI